jgi:5-methylthioribose kinase
VLLDFECAHAGDPTFDLGFFLTHLFLKQIRAIVVGEANDRRYIDLMDDFWWAYLRRRNLELPAMGELIDRANRHTAACCLARVDGKSPVEYLDAEGQTLARAFARLALEVDSWWRYDIRDSFELAVKEHRTWPH